MWGSSTWRCGREIAKPCRVHDAFASHVYSREGLAAARLHAFYLRVALRLLAGMDVPEGLPFMEECRSIAEQSRLSALETGRPVTEIFVEKWCSHFASR